MLAYKTPGVYIEELPANGPIQPVGTSTAAFLGPALSGPTFVPTKVTNWTEFRIAFGDTIVSPRQYMAYAVKGFFDNGGTVAYIVRVGTALRASVELDDRAAAGPPGKAVRLQAKAEGLAGNNIRATVTDSQVVPTAANARVRRASATIASATGNVVVLSNPADAALFRPTDWLTIDGSTERSQLDRIRGNQLVLVSNLNASFGVGSTVRIADLVPNQRVFRVENGAGIEPGSIITLRQGATQETKTVGAVSNEFVTLDGSLANSFAMGSASPAVAITSSEFTLQVAVTGLTETFLNLSMDVRHSRYFPRSVVSTLVDTSLPTLPGVQAPPLNQPAVVANQPLVGGAADNLAAITPTLYQTGLAALAKVDDVNLVCAPDATDQAALVAHCETMGDRFAILDSARGLEANNAGLLLQRASVESARGYAAFYYPWIVIPDPNGLTGTETLVVPPSGHLAGIYARSDTQRGVHKAPANETMTGVVGLERVLNDADQGELNVEGINVLRVFQGKVRPIVWGARTTAPKANTAWRYVNVRRLFIFAETSIKLGINWAVFEPNDLSLWKKLNRTITDFLTLLWRSGALFGDKASQAFYVKIDEELNPAATRALGEVFIEVGMAPVRPAEFVIVRIGIWDGGAQLSES